MIQNQPIVAFITDFGLTDSYVSEMHTVLLSICPFVRVIDVTHNIIPGDIKAGAYIVGRMSKQLPRGAIVVVVVDPGVGTKRQAVLIKSNGRYFIGPDNGVFSYIIGIKDDYIVRIIDKEDADIDSLSCTFHGRDLFTPIAGKLANGSDFELIGQFGNLKNTSPAAKPRLVGSKWIGEVVYIDHFGNIITNLPNDLTGVISVAKDKGIERAESYVDQRDNIPFFLPGSGGYIEISLNRASAASVLAVRVDTPVELLT
ncbi:MAG: SAM-dependent chlorinase/fluorinase [Candidatus Hatepunaea meridiana]|nr:SAM-dependent chlorinase/fluorinase [Candidatus Hatepunaea meridiana]